MTETVPTGDPTRRLRALVRDRYAAAATSVLQAGSPGSCGESCCVTPVEVDPRFGAALYAADQQAELPIGAVAASLGCGNPTAVAELRAGETVLDLGSGGGIDVLLSARRVGPTGFVYGVDLTEEMIMLARSNAATAGATNVEFLLGAIEDLPLTDASVDVVISNCVINLSVDKAAVIEEMFRVLRPGGRIGVSDVVAEDQLSPQDRLERGAFTGCIAGALSETEYPEHLTAAGFVDATVRFTQPAADQMHGAIIRATKPARRR